MLDLAAINARNGRAQEITNQENAVGKLQIRILLGALGLGLPTSTSYGATYEFSYTFGAAGSYAYNATLPITVAGTLTGIPKAGGIVDVNGVLSLSVDGVAVKGRIFADSFSTPANLLVGGGAIASRDPALNNFFFVNGDFLNAGTYDSYFLSVNDSAAEFYHPPPYDVIALADDAPVNVSSWSFSAVPEGGLTAGMLGIATTGLAIMRRRI